MRLLLLVAFVLSLRLPLWGSQPGQPKKLSGVVTRVDRLTSSMEVSCAAVPGVMDAMRMEFRVADRETLSRLRPGATISFLAVQHGQTLFAETVQPASTSSLEREPLEAGNLATLDAIVAPAASGRAVQPGAPVPDFTLVDQTGATVSLAQLHGKVVVVTFGYSRCPFPDLCVRLSDNLERVQERFGGRKAAHDLALLTIAIDPEHDRGAALAAYARRWHADPTVWHFLTGSLPDVRTVASLFSMNFWTSEGLLTHSLHTATIDRQGRLVANWEGNRFTAQQLGDLVESALQRP